MGLFGDKVRHNCCGGTGKHLNGCDGSIRPHASNDDGNLAHSGEVVFTVEDYRKFKNGGGTVKGQPRNLGGGRFAVHVKKWPR